MLWPTLSGLLAATVGAGWWYLNREIKSRDAQFRALQQRLETVNESHRVAELESDTRQRAMFDSMMEGVLLLDSTGRALFANSACRRFFRQPNDPAGLTMMEAFRHLELARLVDELIGGKSFTEQEIQINGDPPRWLQVNGTLKLDAAKNPQGALLVLHDTTRLRQLENTRREFVANVSHELRTPLSLVKGSVETLKSGAKDDPRACARFLDIIERHTDRLIFLIEDLLTLSQLEAGQAVINFHTVPLRTVVAEVLSDLEPKSETRKVSLVNAVPDSLFARADYDRLQQVLSNLIDNAIKYGRMGGKVTVSATLQASSGWVAVTVADDGPGIPAEAAARVFERFYRADTARSREQGGTGLGLSIVKHIIQAHGGTVSLDSSPGNGARFTFTLPAAENY